MSSPEEQKLPLSSLTAMVIGSMIGAQIFSLPRTFANATGPFGAPVARTIAAVGMFAVARAFHGLCHVAVPRARSVGASGIVRPPRQPFATWSSPRRLARGVIWLT